MFRKRQDLKEEPVEGDEIFCHEGVSGQDVLIERDLEQGADLVVAVIGQTVTVCHDDQKEVEQELVVGEALPETIAQETMLDKGEAAINPANTVARKDLFVHDDHLL
jgi:hypothetical protein